MPEHNPITPAIMAEQLEITIITLRRWCVAYAAHLSPGANPEPGTARYFTYRDREVLKYVRAERNIGRSLADIADQLADLSFPEVDTDFIPPEPSPVAIESQPLGQDPPGTALAATVPPDYLITIERRFVALEAAAVDAKRDRQTTTLVFLLGLTAGIVLVVGLLALAALWWR